MPAAPPRRTHSHPARCRPRAQREAREDRADANYKVAKEKCDALSGDAKDACVERAKADRDQAQQGKSDAAKRAMKASQSLNDLPGWRIISRANVRGMMMLTEHTADTVLEEVGVEVRDYPEALPMFKAAGAIVDGTPKRVNVCTGCLRAGKVTKRTSA